MADESAECARDVVILALGQDAVRDLEPLAQRVVVGSALRALRRQLRPRDGPLPVRGCGCRQRRRSCARHSLREAASAVSGNRASAAVRACPRAAESRDPGRPGDSSGCRGWRGAGPAPAGHPSRASAAPAAASRGGGRSGRAVSSDYVTNRGRHAVREEHARGHAIPTRRRTGRRSACIGYSAATASRLRRCGIAGAGAATLPFASTASKVVRISASFCGCSTLWPNRFLT